MNIVFGLRETQFGLLLGGETKTGLCFTGMVHSDDNLQQIIATSFPNAISHRDDSKLKPTLKILKTKLSGIKCDSKIRLDVQGTTFQKTVWQSLSNIPPGETRSYSELADTIGKPKAARAVGSACGRNPLAFIFPCHRVLGKNGDLSGFRWGKDIKRALLESEQSNKSDSLNSTWFDNDSFYLCK